VERQNDGWDGGHETWATSDWAVFTVEVKGLQQ
jgi:hypothetical protein